MANFESAYKITMDFEGVYSNHPSDRGGETWKGIARNFYPQWTGWEIIDKAKKLPNFPQSLSKNVELEYQVQHFFKAGYWDPMWLDNCPSNSIARELFDTAVNMGIGISIQFLQDSLNVLNRRGTLYPDLKVDGAYGPATHSSFMKFFSAVPKERWRALYVCLNALQGARYISICRNNETQEDFMYGWSTRVFEQARDGVYD